jgi:uncharacterized integral membrane protein
VADRTPADGDRSGLQPKEIARLVVAALVAILFIAFIVDNSNTVAVGFVFFGSDVPLIWVLVVTFILGVVIDRLIISARARHRRR